jgi:hypothetical protein
VEHSDFKETESMIIKIKHDPQGKGVVLLGFPFTDLKVVVVRTDYNIDNHTIKR